MQLKNFFFSIYIQDDMIDDVETFVTVAEVLKERGAYKIYVVATHGLLSADAPRLLDDSHIDEVILFLMNSMKRVIPSRFISWAN